MSVIVNLDDEEVLTHWGGFCAMGGYSVFVEILHCCRIYVSSHNSINTWGASPFGKTALTFRYYSTVPLNTTQILPVKENLLLFKWICSVYEQVDSFY